MNFLHDAAGALVKMFVGDAWLSVGVLIIVSLTGLVTVRPSGTPVFGFSASARRSLDSVRA